MNLIEAGRTAHRIVEHLAATNEQVTVLDKAKGSWESATAGHLVFHCSWFGDHAAEALGVSLSVLDGSEQDACRYLPLSDGDLEYGIDEMAGMVLSALDEMVTEARDPWDAHLPVRGEDETRGRFWDGLPVRRWPHECQGKVLFLQSSGMTVVPHRGHKGSYDCMVVESDLRPYPAGQGISVGTDELMRAIERPLVDRSA
ncbi:hypothetical protein LG293_16540 (plasmid) [Citricoccus nitrophenolicus]